MAKRFGGGGAVLWALCFQFFACEQVARLGWTTPYSFLHNFISDLGAATCADRPPGSGHYVCSPWHPVMNISFFVQGLLISGGALLAGERFARLGRGFLFASGLGLCAVGLAPEDVTPPVHFVGAAVHLTCGGLGMVFLGQRAPRIIGLVALTALVLLATKTVGPLGLGGMERLAGYPLPLFLCATGVRLLAKRRDRIDS